MVSATLFMACFSKCKDGATHSRRFLDCKGTKKIAICKFITQILQKNVAFFALILQKNKMSEG